MVEAAGVEPASASISALRLYMLRVPSIDLACTQPNGQDVTSEPL